MPSLREEIAAFGLADDEVESLVEVAAVAPQPEALLRDLGRLHEARPRLGYEELRTFVILASQGTYPARSLVRHPEDLAWIVERAGRGRSADEVAAGLRAALGEGFDEARLYEELRACRRRESLRIFYREVERTASMRQTAAEIAGLAEGCLDIAVRACAELMGAPALADDFCVLGMGKLGGEELNFSSDVDLIYVCSDAAGADEARAEQMRELARSVTAAIERSTADGHVFRVDLRLRPEGTQGKLVQPASAMKEYYLSWGRTWERSAMMKARAVAGARELGREILEALEPFIFRKYLDYTAIDELRAMKEKIDRSAQASAVLGQPEREAEPDPDEHIGAEAGSLKSRLRQRMKTARSGTSRRPSIRRKQDSEPHGSHGASDTTSAPEGEAADPGGVRGWDVKIGAGGIREIEFFVQALQLVHCGTRPNLRVRNTLEALDRLLYAGLVTHDDHASLADAYDLFRRIEHRIQMEHDRQSHRVPASLERFEALAIRLRTTGEELEATVRAHREGVRGIFDRLFRESAQAPDRSTVAGERPSALDTVLAAPADRLDAPAVIEGLTTLGFERPRQVAGQLQILREKAYGPFSDQAAGELAELGRYLVESAAAAPNPDQAFSYLTRFVTTVGKRPGYHRMLAQNPHATRLLVHVFGSSSYLAAALVHDPNIFERLLGVGTIAVVRSREAMVDDLTRRLSGVEDPAHRLGIVRRFRQEETLRIGLHETGGAASIEETMGQLSLLAEVVIDRVLREVYEPLRTRRRRPGSKLPELDDVPFCVVAMGKLGGHEMGFGSDLDVVFVYEDFYQWRLEHTFYARLAQRLIRTLSSPSTEGKLYEVDTRLRPSGSQGVLVVSMDAFAAYHEETAELWERQALLRARPIAGPERLRRAVMEVRQECALRREAPADAAASVRAMRDRIQDAAHGYGTLDVKFSPGGLVDVEFLTQYLQICHGREEGRALSDAEASGLRVVEGATSQRTAEALAGLAELASVRALGLDLEGLIADYETLREIEARLRMSDLRGSSTLPGDPAELDVLARRLGYQGEGVGQALESDVRGLFERVAAVFERALG